MKKNGFTLIELLGVLIVLSVLALITIPIATNVLQKSEKTAFENSTKGILRTIKNNADESNYEAKIYIMTDGILTTTDSEGNTVTLKTNGGGDENGSFSVDEDGIIKGSVHDGYWCAKKLKNKEKLQITEYLEHTCYVD